MIKHASVPLEIKSMKENTFTGYGAVFGNVDLGGDIILPGAFRKSLATHKKEGTMPLMYWMHKADQVPGVWLDMGEDKNGLVVEGEIIDTTLGVDVKKLLEKKAVRGLSIGYQTVEADWRDDGVRVLKQLNIHEVSIVSMAMNPLAKVESLKARLSQDGEYVPTERELEDLLRKVGCSRSVSRVLVAKMFDGEVDTSGMLDGDPSGMLDSAESKAEREALESLSRLVDSLYATALRT